MEQRRYGAHPAEAAIEHAREQQNAGNIRLVVLQPDIDHPTDHQHHERLGDLEDERLLHAGEDHGAPRSRREICESPPKEGLLAHPLDRRDRTDRLVNQGLHLVVGIQSDLALETPPPYQRAEGTERYAGQDQGAQGHRPVDRQRAGDVDPHRHALDKNTEEDPDP